MKTIITTALAASFAVPAWAQGSNCAPVQQIVTNLSERYGESPIAHGLRGENQIITFWANAETGTWTITTRLPNGVMCVAVAGEAVSLMMPEPSGVDG